MMQLYDQEEIMGVHDIGVAKDAAIRAIVEAYKELGLAFTEAVRKIAEKFTMSQENAEREVEEYWKE